MSTQERPYIVVGAGAIGGTLAVRMAEIGVPVTVVDTDAEHVDAIRLEGLTLVTASGPVVARMPAHTLADAPARLGPVILAVKSQATEAAMRWIAPRLDDDGYVVSMQNGLNEATIAGHVGPDKTVAAFVDLFADVVAPGVIQDGGPGAMTLGEYSRANGERVARLASDLRGWGTPVVSDNVEGFLWSKLGFGAMLSATALADDDMGALIDRHRGIMLALTREVFDVARHLGVDLEDFDAFRPLDFVRGADPARTRVAFDDLVAWLATQPKKRLGIWRDLAVRGRDTEVAAHYAPVFEHGDRFGVSLPMLRALVDRIGRLERKEATMSEELLATLDDARGWERP